MDNTGVFSCTRLNQSDLTLAHRNFNIGALASDRYSPAPHTLTAMKSSASATSVQHKAAFKQSETQNTLIYEHQSLATSSPGCKPTHQTARGQPAQSLPKPGNWIDHAYPDIPGHTQHNYSINATVFLPALGANSSRNVTWEACLAASDKACQGRQPMLCSLIVLLVYY